MIFEPQRYLIFIDRVTSDSGRINSILITSELRQIVRYLVIFEERVNVPGPGFWQFELKLKFRHPFINCFHVMNILDTHSFCCLSFIA